MIPRVDFAVFDEFEVILITKESQGIPGYIPNQVRNTTEILTATAFSSLKSPTCCTKPRVALDGNKFFLRQVICGFLGFIDNLMTLFYKRNKKLSRCISLEMHVKHSAIASLITRDTCIQHLNTVYNT